MKDTVLKINEVSERIGSKLSGFLSDTGHPNSTADALHLYIREVAKNILFEAWFEGEITFLSKGKEPVSYDEATADFMKEYPQQRNDFDAFDPAPLDDEKPTGTTLQEEIASGVYDNMQAIPCSMKNIWVSPVDARPHYKDDEGWIYARGYMPVPADVMVTNNAYNFEKRLAGGWYWPLPGGVRKFKLD